MPFSIITDAVVPRPCSIWDSKTIPLAMQSGLAFSSITSACKSIISSKLSIFVPFIAETSTVTVSPPQSSGAIPFSCICCFTRSTLAPLASILLIATTIALLACCANLRASSVWGLNASSAAITSTEISVTFAPRARIIENAA